ncbi:type II toxin-antitoxin system HicB family antitoxin [Azotobacter salinestris]|uniref:type II toxin-antitoxin system HicB family antitoxin n=1 Tax=Azotobacter salinestris TaxID=69964 RepID=UPI0032DE4870
MKNTMVIDGYKAVIEYDPEIEMFRGEFVGLNGGADFYAADIEGLKREGATSLRVFLEMCAEDGVEPRKVFSGKFNVRVPPELHADMAVAAAAAGKSLNQWVVETLDREAHA